MKTLFLILIVFIASDLSAQTNNTTQAIQWDSIIMKNGSVIQGKILKVKTNTLTYTKSFGESISQQKIQCSEITQIICQPKRTNYFAIRDQTLSKTFIAFSQITDSEQSKTKFLEVQNPGVYKHKTFGINQFVKLKTTKGKLKGKVSDFYNDSLEVMTISSKDTTKQMIGFNEIIRIGVYNSCLGKRVGGTFLKVIGLTGTLILGTAAVGFIESGNPDIGIGFAAGAGASSMIYIWGNKVKGRSYKTKENQGSWKIQIVE
jgi:hypothetical protein